MMKFIKKNKHSRKIRLLALLFGFIIIALVCVIIMFIGQNKTRIAIIMDTIGDEQFLIQAENKAKEMAETDHFDLEIIECTNEEHWQYNTRKASKENFDLIIGVGYQAAEEFALASKENLDTNYATIDVKSGSLHVKSVEFNEGESAYVLGVMIGSAFKNEAKIGYISSFQNQGTYKYRYQFEQGVLSVSPNSEILYEYINSYSDANAAYDKSMYLKSQGVNFIMGGVSSSANQGIFKASQECAKNGDPFYTTGLCVDQTTEKNPYIIGGLLKNTDVATELIIDEFLANQFERTNHVLGIKDHALGVVHVTTDAAYRNSDIMTDEVIAKAKDIVDKIMSGKLVIVTPEEQ